MGMESKAMESGSSISRRTLLATGALGVGTIAGCGGLLGESRAPGDTEAEPTENRPTTTADRTTTPTPIEDQCTSNPVIEGNDPLRRSTNTREALRCLGESLDSFETLSHWDTYTGQIEPDTQTVWSGEQSARITIPAETNRAAVYRRFEPAIDLTDRDLSLAMEPGSGETKVPNLTVQLLAPDRDNRIDMWHAFGPLSGWFRLDMGPTRIHGDPDLTTVRELRLATSVGDRAAEFNVDSIRLTPARDRGMVVLTFDDNHITQYETAFPIMEEYGFPGVVGTIPWIADDEDRAGVEELRELQSAGWDIASHPQVDSALPTLSETRQEELLRETKQWLLDNGLDSGAEYIIYPYGKADGTTLELASQYHALGFAGGRCPSGIPTDPLTVDRVSGDHPERVASMVEFAAEYRQLVVVMYHTITGSGGRIDPEAFRETMAMLEAANVDVVSATELYEQDVRPYL